MANRRWVVWALFALVACEGEAQLFLRLPQLQPNTETVVFGVECAGNLRVEVMEPSATMSGVQKLSGCETLQRLSFLEYDFPKEEKDWRLGNLEYGTPEVCLAKPLPPDPSVIHQADIEDGDTAGFAPAESMSAAMAAFHYSVPCPCRPFDVVTRVELPVQASRVFVSDLDEQSVAMVAASRTGDLHVFRYDLENLEHLLTTTIATYLSSTATVVPGVNDIGPGPSGRLFIGGDFGEVFEVTVDAGLRRLAPVPNGGDIESLAASPEGQPFELFVLTRGPLGIARYDGARWHEYALDHLTYAKHTARRHHITWVGPGRAMAITPDQLRIIAYTDGDLLRTAPWDHEGLGSAQVLKHIPGIGPIIATQRTRVFSLNPDMPGEWRELVGPNGRSPDASGAWFEHLHTFDGGFVGSLEGPNTVLRYHEDWGYCPLQVVAPEEIGTIGQIGDTLVFGGGAVLRHPSGD